MALKYMTVAVSDSFFTAYSRLPKNQQAKVMNFVNKFRLDPTSGGINYETLKNVKDNRLRSVRIDDDYRGIVCKPPKGNVYLLLWVDKHDAAYQWAQNRVCEINPCWGRCRYSVSMKQRCCQTVMVTRLMRNLRPVCLMASVTGNCWL